MSLGIVIKGPEGIVLAAESRVTLTAQTPTGPLHVNFDNATKVLSFHAPNTAVGAVTYGQASIGIRTAHSFVPEFEASLPPDRLSVSDFAQRLSDFFIAQWNLSSRRFQHRTSAELALVGGEIDLGAPSLGSDLRRWPAEPLRQTRQMGSALRASQTAGRLSGEIVVAGRKKCLTPVIIHCLHAGNYCTASPEILHLRDFHVCVRLADQFAQNGCHAL